MGMLLSFVLGAAIGACFFAWLVWTARRNGLSDGPWYGFDLDGTLAEYHGWSGADHIGPPIDGQALDAARRYLAAGKDVRIVTARVGPRADGEDVIARVAIRAWCVQVFGRELPVTATKDGHMVELWDDRAVQVVTNRGTRVDGGRPPTLPRPVDPAERKVELELLVRQVLGELAGEASMCWDPMPSTQVFRAELATAAADRAGRRIAELVAPRLAALDSEIAALVQDRNTAERDAREVVDVLRFARRAAGLPPGDANPSLIRWIRDTAARADHLAWVSAMTLGIAEGAQGWGLVHEYPAGHPKAEGMPAIHAVKALRRNLQASLERESKARGELEQLRNMTAPEHVPCPLEPSNHSVLACADALNPADPGQAPRCAEAERCHQVVREKAPALLEVHAAAGRVALPS